MSLFEGDDCFASSNLGRLACESPSESVTIPESDDVESDFDRFNDGFSSITIGFDCRELIFNVDAISLGKIVRKSRKRMYLSNKRLE